MSFFIKGIYVCFIAQLLAENLKMMQVNIWVIFGDFFPVQSFIAGEHQDV